MIRKEGAAVDDTIDNKSTLGKRLKDMKNTTMRFVVFMGRSIPLVAKLTIGREKDNSIQIDDSMASRYHAVIQKIGQDFFIQDLSSTNGTVVNDMQIPGDKYVKLNPKDVIRIGRTEFMIK
jgi:hypothetical protein